MDNYDWEKFGADIKSSVQDAIESGDYSRLNQTITDTVNGVVNGVGDAVREFTGQGFGGQRMDDAYRQTRREYDYRTGKYREIPNESHQYQESYSKQGTTGNGNGNGRRNNDMPGGAERYRYHSDGKSTQNQRPRSEQTARANGYTLSGTGGQGKMQPALFAQLTGRKIGGMALSVVGYSAAVISGVLGLICLLGMLASTASEMAILGAGVGVFAVLAAIFGAAAGIGTSWLKSVKRFRAYIRELGGKEYCDIKGLAQRMRKTTRYVVKDLQKMISRGWFREGHLDEQKTCLMVSHDAYQQYTALLEHTEQKEREEQEVKRKAEQLRREEAENSSILPPEAREVLKSGDEYLRKIRACNDAIPGEEISAKISRIEILVDRIFVRVKEHPDTVSDLNRMMQYYLPTTVKLLEAYEQLDSQPVQGENIQSSKQEIEKTLDTLNVAFEKLLDSLFQDTAWDVSSDISVLHTMLAQEGLTEDSFKDAGGKSL